MKYSIEIALYSMVTALLEFRRAKCRKSFFLDNFFFVVGCRCRPFLQQMGVGMTLLFGTCRSRIPI